jgi:hypothetical protein
LGCELDGREHNRECVNGSVFSFGVWFKVLCWEHAMNDITDYGDMELWCLQRARDEPENAWKWQGQAQRWREIAHARIRNDFGKRPVQQQMTAAPMEMGLHPVTGRRQTQQS